MVILAVLMSGVVAFLAAVFVVTFVHTRFHERWTARLIDAISIGAFVAFMNCPCYVMAAFNRLPLSGAVWIHVGLLVFFALFAGLRVQSAFETFFICVIISILAAFSGSSVFDAVLAGFQTCHIFFNATFA